MTGALSLLAGVLLGLLAADVPGAPWAYAAAALLGLWLLSSARHRSWSSACAMLLAGQLAAGLQASHWREHCLPVPGADVRILAAGIIASVPNRDGATLRFDLRMDETLLRVQWRDPPAAPRVGERWQLLLRLSPLEETRNFAGMDAARLAFRAGVHGTGRVLPSAMNELRSLAPASLDTVRARIAARIGESIADPDAAALVTALAVGLTSGLSRDQWRVFNTTGTTHLVAISGMHVTLFAWLAFRGARFGWRHLPVRRWMQREPFALLLGLAAAGGYSLLAGLSVPTQRTWLMLALYVCAKLAARRVGSGRLWAMALILVLLTDARAPLAAGFWLSFIAVGVLLAFLDGKHAALRVQLSVMLALMPASFAIFGGVSLVGLVVNLAAIPVISLVFVPIVLIGALASWLAPVFDAPFFSLAAGMYEWLWPGLVACADFKLGALDAAWRAAPTWWWFFLAAPATLVWLCRWPWVLRLSAACALLPLWFEPPRAPPTASVALHVLDAGRGTAALLQTRHHVLLFDTGDAWNTQGARLTELVLPALDALDLERVDGLVLPRLDEDRARAAALLALDRQLTRVHVVGDWPGSGLGVRCRDATWSWDGVGFTTYAQGLHCLLRVFVPGHAILLAGDLDAAAESALLARLPPGALVSDVVVIGRQASDLGSSQRWIENTDPGLAIATGGIAQAQSRQRVLTRWRGRARVVDTRNEGAVVLELSTRGIALERVVRTSRYPFHWRRPPV